MHHTGARFLGGSPESVGNRHSLLLDVRRHGTAFEMDRAKLTNKSGGDENRDDGESVIRCSGIKHLRICYPRGWPNKGMSPRR